MAKKPKPGDRVRWNTSQGETTGVVRKELTRRTKIRGHEVAASPEEPEYLVESEKSGKRAAHRAEALTKMKRR